MLIHFTKMHGLGNDFMVVDNTDANIVLSAEQIVALADRHFGVGFDQLLLVESSTNPDVDFRYVIYNADGSEVEQCGNGARCFAKFVADKGLSQSNPIQVETRSGIISLFIHHDGSVRVDMGKPSFEPEQIPLLAQKQDSTYLIEGFKVGVLSMGNPHCVMRVDAIDAVDVAHIALTIQHSDLLPNQANVGFMQVLNPERIHLRVYERGVGETLACGSGACAAVVFGVEQGWLNNQVVVNLSGGQANVEYDSGKSVFLSGPASFVFEGVIEI